MNNGNSESCFFHTRAQSLFNKKIATMFKHTNVIMDKSLHNVKHANKFIFRNEMKEKEQRNAMRL